MVSKKKKLKRYLIRIYGNGLNHEYIITASSKAVAEEKARLIVKNSFPLAKFEVREVGT